MDVTFKWLKVLVTIWPVLLILNYFRGLFWVLASLVKRTDVDMLLMKKAKSLLILGAISSWVTIVLVYFTERILFGINTGYSAILMCLLGFLFMIVAIGTVISSIAVSWSRNECNYSCAVTFRNYVSESYTWAIFFWVLTWVISQIREGVDIMVEKLSGTMYIFGIIFLIVAIAAAIAAFLSAAEENKVAAMLAKGLFSRCLFFSLLLWILAWLIS